MTQHKNLILKLLQQFPEVNPMAKTCDNQTAFDLLILNECLTHDEKEEVVEVLKNYSLLSFLGLNNYLDLWCSLIF